MARWFRRLTQISLALAAGMLRAQEHPVATAPGDGEFHFVRLMVAINWNMDLGDAWEHADVPEHPEKTTGLAYRYAINYILYAMTH